jgi:hypothetical protein
LFVPARLLNGAAGIVDVPALRTRFLIIICHPEDEEDAQEEDDDDARPAGRMMKMLKKISMPARWLRNAFRGCRIDVATRAGAENGGGR